MKKKFYEFLKKNDALEKFKTNAKNNGKNLSTYWKDRESEMYLLDAFIWQNTPEDHDYWKNLDIQWRRGNY